MRVQESLDRVVMDSPRPRLGIITTGKSYLDVRQALADLGIDERLAAQIGLRLYKVGMPWPLGEEGVRGKQDAAQRWVVDPIDGTVNFTYGIPHACVSIALQTRVREDAAHPDLNYRTDVGVVFDPFCKELWTARRGQPARMNGKRVRVSERDNLEEVIFALGFAKYETTLAKMLPVFNRMVHRVRKIRIMGAAALSMVYVAGARMDAYKEYGVRLWDIAAGGLIIECAGGEFWHRPVEGEHTYEIMVSNGRLREKVEAVCRGK